MNKIKKGDEVIVITGKDKGKRGNVLAVLDHGKKLTVEGINMVSKHTKGNPNAGVTGGIVKKNMPIDSSNVMMYDAASGKGSRVGIKTLSDGQRVRFLKSSGQQLEERN